MNAERQPAAPRYDDRSTRKVILFAGTLIVIAVTVIGWLVYAIAERAVLDKMKNRDLPLLLDSVTEQLDGRIRQAEETSILLADDPLMVEWIVGEERDRRLSEAASSKLKALAERHGYATSYFVSAVTQHYWAETGEIIETVSADDPDDDWFFMTLKQKEKVSVQIDWHEVRKGTFVFVNALMGTVGDPIGVAGVGFSLEGMSDYLRGSKYSEAGNIWVVDGRGEIVLSDEEVDQGTMLSDKLPVKVANLALAVSSGGSWTSSYDAGGHTNDLVVRPLAYGGIRLVVQVPRSYSVDILDNIRLNAIFAVAVSLLSFVFVFFYISRRLADPYKRALELNRHLERIVDERTAELRERNQAIMDSIDYAKRIQESLLPSDRTLAEMCREYFVLWKPRDVVGGDFYWAKKREDGWLIAVGDCTGHGVPGAMMTMLAVSLLERIADQDKTASPDEIVSRLHRLVRSTLQQDGGAGATDDGLDIGICLVSDGRAEFVGAGSSLYRHAEGGTKLVKGDRRSVGYRRTPADFRFTRHTFDLAADETLYMTTDGFLDQNGGEKDYSFGRTRWLGLIERCGGLPLEAQRKAVDAELRAYQKGEAQRDDILVLAFRPRA